MVNLPCKGNNKMQQDAEYRGKAKNKEERE
jgi:hypothetical protein